MLTLIEDSKYIPEVVSIVISFSDVLSPGDYIVGTPSITITVSSGIDPSPSNLLYLGVIVTNGNTVEQRFRKGVIGVIYNITFSIITQMGYTLEKETYLAILPIPGDVYPTHNYLYLTSQLYPLQTQEQYQTFIAMQDGLFWLNPRFGDNYQTYVMLQDGSFTLAQVFYTAPGVDFYETYVSIQDGYLTGALVTYVAPSVDFYTTGIAILTGTLVEAQVFYTNPSENYQTYISIQNGTLA